MAEIQLVLPGQLVKVHNEFARARICNLESVIGQRILASLISCIGEHAFSFKESYSIDVKTFIPESGSSYKNIKAICKDTASALLEIKYGSDEFSYIPIFRELTYKKGKINATFNDHASMKKCLLDLKKFFTEFNLIEYLKLPSSYSQKIFLFLKSWKSEQEHEERLDNLMHMLNVSESFKRYPDFKRFVLDKAYKDINKETTIRYEWEPIKKGRSVVAIRFVFSGGKKSIVAKGKKVVSDQKTSQENNKYFKAAVKCHQSDKCNFKPTSKMCGICKKLFPTE